MNDAWWHAGGNVLAVLIELYNWYLRYRSGEAAIVPTGLLLSLIVVCILLFTGWKGWKLVYLHRVGVSEERHGARSQRPWSARDKRWRRALPSNPIGVRWEAGAQRARSARFSSAKASLSKVPLPYSIKISRRVMLASAVPTRSRAILTRLSLRERREGNSLEITSKRCGPEFFAGHKLSELEHWSDHELEEVGRLTEPMRYDLATDTYRVIAWSEAFAEIGLALKGFDPTSVIFYTSGRASLEASYMYQLFARMYGSNNLPDSSNMCHESTSVALPETIGVPVGTVKIEDFADTDCMFFFGQNVGVNSPRMLHQLQEVRQRGAPIITFNPLRSADLSGSPIRSRQRKC